MDVFPFPIRKKSPQRPRLYATSVDRQITVRRVGEGLATTKKRSKEAGAKLTAKRCAFNQKFLLIGVALEEIVKFAQNNFQASVERECVESKCTRARTYSHSHALSHSHTLPITQSLQNSTLYRQRRHELWQRLRVPFVRFLCFQFSVLKIISWRSVQTFGSARRERLCERERERDRQLV